MLKEYEKRALERRQAKEVIAKKQAAAAAAADQAGGQANASTSEETAGNTQSEYIEPMEPPQAVEATYDQASKGFYIVNDEGDYVYFDKGAFRTFLGSKNWPTLRAKGKWVTAADLKMQQIMLGQSVHFAGELAGWERGVKEIAGHRVLITRGPKLKQAKKGPWPLLRHFFRTLLGGQDVIMFGWLKGALTTMRQGAPFREGQVLCMAGDVGCGKNLCQQIITDVLGGREGKPWEYLCGNDKFTGDFNRSEHLVIADEVSSTTPGARVRLKQKLKQFIVNKRQRIRPMGSTPINLEPFCRITISVNQEPENVAVLPPPDGDMADKMILMLCRQGEWPRIAEGNDRGKADIEAFRAELPAFLYYLENLELKDKWLDPKHRFAVLSYKHPKLLAMLLELQPSEQILQFIDAIGLPWPSYGARIGYPEDFAVWLKRNDPTKDFERLLQHGASQMGQYLKELSVSHPNRVFFLSEKNRKRLYLMSRDATKRDHIGVMIAKWKKGGYQ